MVCTDQFVGKCKVKDRWEEGEFVVVKQLEDWPVYKVQCPPTGNRRNPQYRILHRNRLMLVPPEEDTASDPAQLAAAAAIVLNANMETLSAESDSESLESERLNSTLLTQQSGDQTSHVWINREFRTRLYTQSEGRAIEGTQGFPGQ